MVTIHLWHLTILIFYVTVLVTSSQVEVPAGEEKKSDEKRSGHYCNVNGHIFQHGEVFSYPGSSHCIKYRCNNGGYRVVRHACERNGRCILEGHVHRDGCRSLRCTRESRGRMNIYRMEPTVQDQCEVEPGRCVPKNRPFEHSDCHTYRCVPTGYGGYRFDVVGSAKCKDAYGRCIAVGRKFVMRVKGRLIRNCTCLQGGWHYCSSG